MDMRISDHIRADNSPESEEISSAISELTKFPLLHILITNSSNNIPTSSLLVMSANSSNSPNVEASNHPEDMPEANLTGTYDTYGRTSSGGTSGSSSSEAGASGPSSSETSGATNSVNEKPENSTG